MDGAVVGDEDIEDGVKFLPLSCKYCKSLCNKKKLYQGATPSFSCAKLKSWEWSGYKAVAHALIVV